MSSNFRLAGLLCLCAAVFAFGIRDAFPSDGPDPVETLHGNGQASLETAEYSSSPFDSLVDLGGVPALKAEPLALASSVTQNVSSIIDLEAVGGACFVTDGELDGEYDRVLAEAEDVNCGYAPRPQLLRWHTAYNRRFSIRCDLAAALNAFAARLDRIADEELGTTVEQIDQVGTYTCRNTYGSPEGRPSEHARANAIDISGFHLADGRMVTLAKDWDAKTPEGRFLRRVRDEACGFFVPSSRPITTPPMPIIFISISAATKCARKGLYR